MKTKKGLSLFNIIFMVVLVVALISSLVGMFFVGGYTPKTISMIVIAIAIGLTTSGIYGEFQIKEKDKDERIIIIRNKAKAKAFDATKIVFGILIIIYVLLKVNLLTIVLVAVSYLIIMGVYDVCLFKYHKKM